MLSDGGQTYPSPGKGFVHEAQIAASPERVTAAIAATPWRTGQRQGSEGLSLPFTTSEQGTRNAIGVTVTLEAKQNGTRITVTTAVPDADPHGSRLARFAQDAEAYTMDLCHCIEHGAPQNSYDAPVAGGDLISEIEAFLRQSDNDRGLGD